MSGKSLDPILIARANEMLRQERDTFDERKRQEHTWFVLRVVMGWTSVALLITVLVVSTFILLRNKDFPTPVITAAGAALFGDLLGLLIGVWKIVLNPKSVTKLGPVTRVQIPQEGESGGD